MKGKNSLVVGTAVIAFILTGCAGTYNKSETGIGLGALTGGALAYGLAKDSSKKELWTVLGIGLGAMVGQDIGAKQDDRDRMLAGQALEQTLEHAPTDTAGSWSNPDSGNSGTFTPVKTFQTAQGSPCREFVQTIYVGGQEQEGYGTACRQADGSWKITQS